MPSKGPLQSTRLSFFAKGLEVPAERADVVNSPSLLSTGISYQTSQILHGARLAWLWELLAEAGCAL